MAIRKRNPAYKKRRTTKKRMVQRRRKAIVKKRINYGPFPRTRIVKMKLCTDQLTLACSAGAIGYVDVSANNPTYSGRNAFGWDQWAALYNQFIVLGSKITFYQQGYNDSSVTSCLMGIYLSDDSTNYTDYRTLVENRMGRFVRCSTAKERIPKVTQTFSAKKFFNCKDIKDNFDRLGASVSSSPTESAVFKIWAQPINKTASPNIYGNAVIEYIVLFSERKDVPAS